MSEVKVNKISPRTNCGTVTVGDSGDSVSVTAGVPVTVNGDLKSNALKAVDGGSIISQCGTNITLGASGDTINLAAGASQTGFGRTGTVDWDTTAKTASFTAVSGNGYFVNTTSGAITMTLPASPSAGDIVSVKDYANTFDTNNLTIGRNGQPISGETADAVIDTEGQALTLVYVDATKGWQSVAAATESDLPKPTYIVATGGTVTCCGDYKIHTFTGPGTFTVCSVGNAGGSNTVDYLVIAGGGGGGSDQGGGGGAGGYRESSGAASGCYTTSPLGACVSALAVGATGYPISIGGGGVGALSCLQNSSNGSNSSFSSITSTGGGRAGTLGQPVPAQSGSPGGSGGGGGGRIGNVPETTGGTGNTPPVSPPQGTDGAGQTGATSYGGSGGGATGAGAVSGCAGSAGATSCITASPVGRAGGGGGRATPTPAGVPFGAGPYGPGADGGSAANGTANTGSGGGGGGIGGPTPLNQAGAGGSGIVIIRYKYQ
jgi:hypothetical protein